MAHSQKRRRGRVSGNVTKPKPSRHHNKREGIAGKHDGICYLQLRPCSLLPLYFVYVPVASARTRACVQNGFQVRRHGAETLRWARCSEDAAALWRESRARVGAGPRGASRKKWPLMPTQLCSYRGEFIKTGCLGSISSSSLSWTDQTL